jgi:chromosome segregation ATPase
MQKNMIKSLIVTMAGLASVAMWNKHAGAEPKGQDAAVQQVLRKAQGVVRQLTEEKAALETEKVTLLGQKTALETQNSALEAEKTALLKEKTNLESRLKKTEETLKPLQPLPAKLKRCEAGVESLQTELMETRSRERAAIQAGQAIESDNRLLLDAVKEREVWINACGRRNQDLLNAGREAIARYSEKGFWDKAIDAEPLTGIGKVRTEDAAQAYRYKIEHLKVAPFQAEVKLPESVSGVMPNDGGEVNTQ